MSKRSLWCDFDKETKKYIKKRDKETCVCCGARGALQAMHIFLSRAHGGHGCKENGAMGCVKCHVPIYNSICSEQVELGKQLLARAKTYLIEKENIIVNKEFIDSLKYKKVIVYDIKQIAFVKPEHRCESCRFIRKNKFNNSSIPSYFCVANKKVVGKKNEACKSFKEGGI